MQGEVVIDLLISKDEYLRYYQGSAKNVLATAIDGRKVRFPANILQRFVTHSGIRGRFAIIFDNEGRFVEVQQIASY